MKYAYNALAKTCTTPGTGNSCTAKLFNTLFAFYFLPLYTRTKCKAMLNNLFRPMKKVKKKLDFLLCEKYMFLLSPSFYHRPDLFTVRTPYPTLL